MKNILEIENLSLDIVSKSGRLPVLDKVSLSIPPGQSLGVVGESGSGKSLLCHSVMGLLDPGLMKLPQGQIFFNGKDLLSLSDNEMRKIRGRQIAMIFQDPMKSLNPVLSIGYQVSEGVRVHENASKKRAWAKAVDLINLVGINNPSVRAKDYPHQLSGGQRQRVMIAMALSCSPQLLIADEPTTSLDVTTQKKILELLVKIRKQREMSILFVSHDLATVRGLVDEVCVLKSGSLVEKGKADAVLRSPKHPYTKALVQCRIDKSVKTARLAVLNNFIDSSGRERNFDEKSLGIKKNYVPDQVESPKILKVEGLSKKFMLEKNFWGYPKSWTTALQDVSFSVSKGRVLGVVGESGCGKTTLARLVSKLETPDSGKIFFHNEDLNKMDREADFRFRKKSQVIFQDPFASLNPKITVGDAVAEPIRVHRLAESPASVWERVKALFNMVGLSEKFLERFPYQLSGGERQRVCIARALSIKPEFLVCDEPVSSLDVSVRGQILNLLLDLKEEMDLTYLFISHDLDVIRFFADDVLVMHNGKIVERGPCEQVLENPKDAYTQSLVDSIPVWVH